MKWAAGILFALYLVLLVWLVIFKLSVDLSVSVFDHYTRSLNLLPFAHTSRSDFREMVENTVIFVPFGLLLGLNLKRVGFWQQLAPICLFSVAIETAQYVLAVGISDITDVITNTVGGLLGLTAYYAARRFIGERWLDRFVLVVGLIALLLCLIPINYLLTHHVRFR